MESKEMRLAKLKRAFKTWKSRQSLVEDYQPDLVSIESILLDQYKTVIVEDEQDLYFQNFA